MWEFTEFSISDVATCTALHTDIACAHRERAWELVFQFQSFWILALELCGQIHASAALSPRRLSVITHWIGNCVVYRASLEFREKRSIACNSWETNHDISDVQPVDWSLVWLSYPLQCFSRTGAMIHGGEGVCSGSTSCGTMWSGRWESKF